MLFFVLLKKIVVISTLNTIKLLTKKDFKNLYKSK